MFTIEPIHIHDVDVLQQLAIRTYEAAFGAINKPGVTMQYYEYAFAKAQLTKELLENHSFWYFAKQANEIVGYLKLNILDAQTEYQDTDGLEIERIYIDVPYLNKGYGKQCIDFAILKARELGKNYIWLGVWEKNPDAIRFYKKNGFVITGTHDYDMKAEIQTDFIMKRNL